MRPICFAAAVLAACGATPKNEDRGDACADVGAIRACWAANQPAPRVVTRPLPTEPARAKGGGPFVCAEEQCVQRYPRVPDDGEWECVDLDGVVVCRGGAAPGGVVPGPVDVGWICGVRAGTKDRVCVDMSPDLPRGEARGYACSFAHRGGDVRTCTKREGAPRIGGVCGAGCPRGAVCSGGACVPRALPRPDCWVDPDCGAGRVCSFGTCGAVDG